jgi:hypothetical protein
MMKHKFLAAGALVFSGLALLAFPLVLMGNLMQAVGAGPRPLLMIAFLATGTLYPVAYFVSLWKCVRNFWRGEITRAVLWSGLPLAWLLVVVVLFFAASSGPAVAPPA